MGEDQYDKSVAKISVRFSDNKTIRIYLDPERESLFAVLRDHRRQAITNKAAAKIFSENVFNVMPPVGRMNIRERVLQVEHVRSNLNTNLAPMHFRNQLYHFGDFYDENVENNAEYLDGIKKRHEKRHPSRLP